MTTLGLVTHAVVLAFESHDRSGFPVATTENPRDHERSLAVVFIVSSPRCGHDRCLSDRRKEF